MTASPSVDSSTEFELATDKLSSEDWTAEGVNLSIQPTTQGFSVWLSIKTFTHKLIPERIHGLAFQCTQMKKEQGFYRCDHGELVINDSPYGAQRAVASLRYVDPTQFSVRVAGLKFAHGALSITAEVSDGEWHVHLKADKLALIKIQHQLGFDLLPPKWHLKGTLSCNAELSGADRGLQQIDIEAMVQQLNYSDQEGLQVAEDGGGQVTLSARQKRGDWSGRVNIDLKQGQFYADPYYFDLTAIPLNIQSNGRWSPVNDRLYIDHGNVQMPSAIDAQGDAIINLNPLEIERLKVKLATDSAGKLYTLLAQPALVGSMIDDLVVSGAIEMDIELKQDELTRFKAQLEAIDIDDQRGAFILERLNGVLAWSKNAEMEESQVDIGSGHLYQIPFGSFSIHTVTAQRAIRLLNPVEIPVLGGAIKIAQFESQDLFGNSPSWVTSAEVNGLSIGELSEAFDWPPMSGELNGKLPAMRYQGQTIELDGALKVDLFGGQIQIGQLMIKKPLGRVPEMFATAKLSDLNLEQITQTFSFGHIEGSLEGWIRNLHLLNWEPVAFQAHFHSPEKDDLPHRISQRAVDNLTSIGNGIGGGLERTFLGLFKEFRYNRMELRAKLDGNLITLDGMDHPDGGYYLVKGAGLPRIDVIARNRRVAWRSLLERLKNIRVEGMKVQ
jgi:hypothetical protein